MSRFDYLTIMTIFLTICALVGDVTGYAKKYGDSGWNALAAFALLAWVVVLIGGWWR